MSHDEIDHIDNLLQDIKLPPGIDSSIKNLVSKPGFLKHIDWVRTLSPLGLWLLSHATSLPLEYRRAIANLIRVTSELRSRSFVRPQLIELRARLVAALSAMELLMPCGWMTMNSHACIHLVQSIINVGPIWATSTFHLERFGARLKGNIKSRKHPEASFMLRHAVAVATSASEVSGDARVSLPVLHSSVARALTHPPAWAGGGMIAATGVAIERELSATEFDGILALRVANSPRLQRLWAAFQRAARGRGRAREFPSWRPPGLDPRDLEELDMPHSAKVYERATVDDVEFRAGDAEVTLKTTASGIITRRLDNGEVRNSYGKIRSIIEYQTLSGRGTYVHANWYQQVGDGVDTQTGLVLLRQGRQPTIPVTYLSSIVPVRVIFVPSRKGSRYWHPITFSVDIDLSL